MEHIQPYQYPTFIQTTDKYIFSYSLNPDKDQPLGECNVSLPNSPKHK